MSGYIGNIPTPQATQTRDTFTATSGQTSFATSGYTPGFLDVFLNGVHLLNGTDYTASNGSDVVLTTGATTGDSLEVVAYTTFQVVDQSFSGNFSVDSPTFVVDAANNRVGVGTASPASRLTVSDGSSGLTPFSGTDVFMNSSGDNYLQFGSGSSSSPAIYFGDSADGDVGGIIYSHATDAMSFRANAAERMRITNIGDVGIGTSSPVAKNHIRGSGTSGQVAASWILENSSSGTAGMDITGAAGASRWRYLYGGGPGTGTNTLTEAMCILTEGASAGNVGIGLTNPGVPLHVKGPTNGNVMIVDATGTAANYIFDVRDDNTSVMRVDPSGNLLAGTTTTIDGSRITSVASGTVSLGLNGSGGAGMIVRHPATNQVDFTTTAASSFFTFSTNTTERARITSGGVLLVGQTTNALADTGHILDPLGLAYHIAAGNPGLNVNRKADDGNLVTFYQDGSLEGTISVSGTTVSYNGGHLARWSQTADNTRIDLLKGTVMTNLDQMAVWGDEDNEQLNCMAVSSVEGDPNVAGVFVNWDNDDEAYTADMNIAMTGDMIIRIAQGTTVQRGDLLMSAGDGTAKPQGDDIIRSKTIAKVTSTHVTCTYEDGSYCVPCVLMAC
jgi:hypothetical protein